MIRLKRPPEETTIELPKYGVTLPRHRTRFPAIQSAAQAAARVAGRRYWESLGKPEWDRELRTSYAILFLAQEQAKLCIQEWTGVEDDNGNPLPVTPENVEAVIWNVPGFAEAYLAKAEEPFDGVVSEGNASGPSANGTSEQGPDTVTIVDPSTPPV